MLSGLMFLMSVISLLISLSSKTNGISIESYEVKPTSSDLISSRIHHLRHRHIKKSTTRGHCSTPSHQNNDSTNSVDTSNNQVQDTTSTDQTTEDSTIQQNATTSQVQPETSNVYLTTGTGTETKDPVSSVVDTAVGAVSSATAAISGSLTGQATYYGTGLGACGITNKDTDMIAAASMLLFDTFPGATGNPNNNPICNRKVKANYQGNSVEVTIVDRCVGCAMYDLDFSPSAFEKLASKDLGRLSGMTWVWV